MITKEYLANYPYISKTIEKDQKALKKMIDNPPTAEYGKVYGSSPQYPFALRGFTVGGSNVKDYADYQRRCRELEVKISGSIRFYKELELEIKTLITEIENPRDKLVFQMLYYDGFNQQQVAMKLNIDQSVVSRTIDKYVKK